MQLIILERERIDKQQQKQNNDEFFLFSNVPRVTIKQKYLVGGGGRNREKNTAVKNF